MAIRKPGQHRQGEADTEKRLKGRGKKKTEAVKKGLNDKEKRATVNPWASSTKGDQRPP